MWTGGRLTPLLGASRLLPGRHRVTFAWRRAGWEGSSLEDFVLTGLFRVQTSPWEYQEGGTTTIDVEVQGGRFYQVMPSGTKDGTPIVDIVATPRAGRRMPDRPMNVAYLPSSSVSATGLHERRVHER